MEVGTPLPANLAEIDAGATLNKHSSEEIKLHLANLHRAHAAYDAEIGEIHGKKVEIKRVLTKIYVNRDNANLAGFDTVLRLGEAKFTVEKAKAYLADAANGFIGLPNALYERLAKIVRSGKDEE